MGSVIEEETLVLEHPAQCPLSAGSQIGGFIRPCVQSLSWRACYGLILHLRERYGWLREVTSAAPASTTDAAAMRIVESIRLARLVNCLKKQWQNAARILVIRLQNDRPRMEKVFGPGLGKILRVQAGLSDPHNGGQTVAYVEFESGVSLYYKPRPVRFLGAWNRIVRSVLEPVFGGMALPRILDCLDYGWVENVEKRQNGQPHELLRHMRAGGVLCLAYVLGSSDLHAENVIDHEVAPVLVDAEMLLWCGVRHAPSIDTHRAPAFDRLFRDSVVRTGLLPRWQIASGNAYLGAGFVAGCESSPCSQSRHVEELIEGFIATYQLLSTPAGTETLLAEISACEEASLRVLIRPTNVYQRILEKSLRAYVEWGGAGRMEMLRRTLSRATETLGAAAPEVVRREAHALLRMDIPRFTRGSLHAAGLHFECTTGADYVRRRLASLCADDLQRQIELIRASFALIQQW